MRADLGDGDLDLLESWRVDDATLAPVVAFVELSPRLYELSLAESGLPVTRR